MFGKGGNDVEYNVAVCDDLEADRKYVSALVEKWAAHTGNTVKITRFSSAENFLFHYAEKKDYDILLLDIEMGEMDGVSMAKRLRQEREGFAVYGGRRKNAFAGRTDMVCGSTLPYGKYRHGRGNDSGKDVDF